MAEMQPVVDQLRKLEDARKDGTIALPDGSRIGVTNLAKLVLAEAQADQGRPAALLRDRRAAHPAGRRRSPARHEALSERRRRPRAVLSAAPAEGTAAGGRAHRGAARRPRSDRRAGRRALHRRLAHHAALHDAARRDLAGSVVLAHAVAARRRLRRDRSRSRRGRDARAGARRRALGARRARVDARAGRAEDVGLARAAHLHSASAGHVVRVRDSSSVRSSRP